ncbi:MAG: carotenoid oxygenase family protein [Deltaproteobacteria bacterium]|nr:carotenoid oxygenase family protein [Deltaproteobacteria bacterium]
MTSKYREARPRMAPSAPGAMNRADRAEHDGLELQLVTEERGPWPGQEGRPGWRGHLSEEADDDRTLAASGPIPRELFGHLFVNSACGTISNPYLPLEGSEVTTMLAGDGYMMRFDLDGRAGTVSLKTRLVRTPCFYLDKITHSTPRLKVYKFFNHGIIRFNWLVGARNMNNTAFYPLPRKGQSIEEPCRMLITWDAGRPWEIDPISLEPKTPVGTRKEWAAEMFGSHPFPVTFGTAHPQWDQETQELFAMNYGKGIDGLIRTVPIMERIHRARTGASRRYSEILHGVGLGRIAQARSAVYDALNRFRTERQDQISGNFLPQRFTYVLRWDGAGAVQRFQLVHPTRSVPPDAEQPKSLIARWLNRQKMAKEAKGLLGASVGISETVHQMCCTKRYIIVLDTGFKVGLDALYGDPLPFGPDALRGFFKTVTTRKVTPYSTFHIVERSAMDESLADWTRRCAADPKYRKMNPTPDVEAVTIKVPSAACHFVADYDDDEGIVLHVAHSDATDVGEWVRAGAKNPYARGSEDTLIDPAYYGLPGVSAIDQNRVAKYVIDVDDQRVVDSQVMTKNPFTWTVALYAERTAGIPTNFSKRVKYLFWNSMGFFPEIATLELRELYQDYIHRKTPLSEIDRMKDTGGRPSTLLRVDTENFVLGDHYILPPGFVCSTPQFLPRKKKRKTVHEDLDGYLSAMVFPPDPPGGPPATPELWIFDANKLSRGPLCMLEHPDFTVGFTIHSAWMGALQPYDPANYKVDLREDFADSFQNVRRGAVLKPIFEEHIYPKFED